MEIHRRLRSIKAMEPLRQRTRELSSLTMLSLCARLRVPARAPRDAVPGLLAKRARDERLGLAFAVVRCAASEQDLRRAFLLRLGVEAFAGAKTFAAAGRRRSCLAVGPAISSHGTALAHRHDARVRQSDHRAGCVLGGVAGLVRELIQRLLRTLEIGLELRRTILEPTADGIDQTRPRGGIRFRCRWRIGSDRNVARRPHLLREDGDGQENDACSDERIRDGRGDTRVKLFRRAGYPNPVTSQPGADSARRVAKLRRLGTSERIDQSA